MICFFFWGCCALMSMQTSVQAQDLLELTRKVTQSIKAPKNSDFHLLYRQTSTTRDRMDLPLSMEVEMKVKGEEYSMVSDQMEAFIDEKNAYVVYKEAKRIFSIQDKEALKAQISNEQMAELLNLMWETAKIQEASSAGAASRKLRIQPSKEMKEASQVEKIEITFDAKTQKLEKVRLYMIEQSFIKTMEYQYLIINDKPSFRSFPSAKSNLFDANGKLKKHYQSYSIQEA